MRRRLMLVCFLVLLVSGTAFAQPYSLELDVDGVVGNGPDSVVVSIGDSVRVEVWAIGEDPGWLSFRIEVCNEPVILALDTVYHIVCWGDPALVSYVEEIGSGCVAFADTTYTFGEGCVFPFLAGTIAFEVVDVSASTVSADLEESRWQNWDFESGYFEAAIPVVLLSEPTGTRKSPWGTIKGLFR